MPERLRTLLAIAVTASMLGSGAPAAAQQDRASEEITVLAARPKWVRYPELEKDYFRSLDARFGRQTAISDLPAAYGGQDPLDPTTWYDPSFPWDITRSHVQEYALMMRMKDRSSSW